MEKWFQPNKWFVLFCGLLLVVYFSLQYVINTELSELGKQVAIQVFTWEWPTNAGTFSSHAMITDAHVLKRGETDAVVQVTARQKLDSRLIDSGKPELPQPNQSQEDELTADLTFYKSGRSWLLGKVELK